MTLMRKLRKMRAVDESVEEIDFSPLEEGGINYEMDGKNIKVYASHDDFMEAMGRDADSCVDYQITFDECRDPKIDEGTEIKKERMTGIDKIEITGNLLEYLKKLYSKNVGKGPFLVKGLQNVGDFELVLDVDAAEATPVIPSGVDVDDYTSGYKYKKEIRALKNKIDKLNVIADEEDENTKNDITSKINKFTTKSDEWMTSLAVKRRPFAELEGKNLSNKQIISMMRKIGAEPVKGKNGIYSWLNEYFSKGYPGYDVLFLSLNDNDGDGRLEILTERVVGSDFKNKSLKYFRDLEVKIKDKIKKLGFLYEDNNDYYHDGGWEVIVKNGFWDSTLSKYYQHNKKESGISEDKFKGFGDVFLVERNKDTTTVILSSPGKAKEFLEYVKKIK